MKPLNRILISILFSLFVFASWSFANPSAAIDIGIIIVRVIFSVMSGILLFGATTLHDLVKIVNKTFALSIQIINDHRIIVARSHLPSVEQEHNIASKDLAIVAFHQSVDSPPENKHKPEGEYSDKKWEKSYSILWGDRIQDYLFSKEYLEHFVKLAEISNSPCRILILNKTHPSLHPLDLFLKISKISRYDTYCYNTEEFNKMIDAMKESVKPKYRRNGHHLKIEEILRSNPELSTLKFNDIDDCSSGDICEAKNYVLRYHDKNVNKVVDVGHAFHDGCSCSDRDYVQVKHIMDIMKAATVEYRKNEAGLKAALKAPIGTSWEDRVSSLKEQWKNY